MPDSELPVLCVLHWTVCTLLKHTEFPECVQLLTMFASRVILCSVFYRL